MASFLEHTHPHYDAQRPKWDLVHAFYSGENASRYLVQRKQGESKKEFEERTELADFHPYVADVLDAIAGMLFQDEDAIERDWGTLGSPEQPTSLAGRLSRNIDGRGTNYAAFLRRLAVDLLQYEEMWVLVEGVSDTGLARVRTIAPTSTPNWFQVTGDDAAVIVRETADTRSSIRDEPEPQEQYLLYETEGWRRYVLESGTERLLSSGSYSDTGRTYVDRLGRTTLPIFRIRLPFSRYVAHQLAKSARALYNNESDRDALQRAASYPKLIITGDDDFFGAQVEALKEGANVLQRLPGSDPHEYIGPPMDGVRAANETLEAKRQAFYEAAWRLYDTEGKLQQTATGALLDRSSGLDAALALIATTLENAEEGILYRLEQVVSDRGWSSSVSWPTSFGPTQMEQAEPVTSS